MKPIVSALEPTCLAVVRQKIEDSTGLLLIEQVGILTVQFRHVVYELVIGLLLFLGHVLPVHGKGASAVFLFCHKYLPLGSHGGR